jgi:hypothetical protein
MKLTTRVWLSGLCVGLALVLAGGCNPRVEKGTGTGTPDDHDDHGGTIESGQTLDLGKEHKYHIKYYRDLKKKEVKVIILGKDNKTPEPIDAKSIELKISNTKKPVQLKLEAKKQDSDPEGKSSQFVGMDDALAEDLEFEGEIEVMIGDSPLQAKLKEDHGDHDH